MFAHNIKIALRNLQKKRLFTILNLSGLAAGLGVSLLLLLYVQDERSFDRQHKAMDRIFRVIQTTHYDGETAQRAQAPNAVGPAAKEAIPEVEQQVRLLKHNFGETAFMTVGEKRFVEDKLFWADASLFAIFDIPFVSGNPESALTEPNTVVLSKSSAEKLFKKEDPIGKTIVIDNTYTLRITGIYQDFPGNSTLDANMIASFQSVRWAQKLVWDNASYETYLLLRTPADKEKVEKQMAALLDQHVAKEDQHYALGLQPFKQVHLYSASIEDSYSTRLGDPQQLQLMLSLAFVIILIACINYMNLATARAQQRFKEVGISKSLGASKGMLMRRFYTETAMMVFGAMVLGVGLLMAALPFFNQLADKQLSIQSLMQPEIGLGLLGIAGVVTVLAGAYPAFFLSGFQPKNLLQQSFQKGSGSGMFRRVLVTFQFAASTALIVCTLIFYQQLQFIQSKKLGYEPEQVLAITTVAAQKVEQIEGLINDCKNLSAVKSVCRAQTFPGRGGSGRGLEKPGQPDQNMPITTNRVTSGFEQVLQLKMIAGTSLPIVKESTDTTVQVVLNETAVKFLGYSPEEAIGKTVRCQLGNDGNAEIVGVVADFNYSSLHQPIGAYAFHNYISEQRRFLLAKIDTRSLGQTLSQLETMVQNQLPGSAFEYEFLDAHLEKLYRTEKRTATVVFIFSMLAILIAALGLFGLAAFAAEQRTKEIGVRKVLGASVAQIVQLLATDTMKVVLIAIPIAVLPAWYFMHNWLNDFAYRIDIQWWVFALAGAITLLLAFLTVSSQSIKAALANPVRSLKNE
jgi:putative ABC transport system permease protein